MGNPTQPCVDCDCKDVGAWSFDGYNYAHGYRTWNSDTGVSTSVAYAQSKIGSVGGCQKDPAWATTQKVWRYEYNQVKQACKKLLHTTIEFTFSDEGLHFLKNSLGAF